MSKGGAEDDKAGSVKKSVDNNFLTSEVKRITAKQIAAKEAERQREASLAAIPIKEDDAKLVADQLDLTLAAATKKLQRCGNDLEKALWEP